MMIKIALGLLLLSQGAFAASFDCTKANQPIEKAICNDSKISELDSQLSINYKNRLKNHSVEAQTYIKETQRQWNKYIQKECKSENKKDYDNYCLSSLYTSRINELGNVKKVGDTIVYTKNHKVFNNTYEQFDSTKSFYVTINKEIEQIVKSREDFDTESHYESSIVIDQISPKIYRVTNHEEGVGAYPWSINSYFYYDRLKENKLSVFDFFKKDKLNELSQDIYKDLINQSKNDKEMNQCIESVNSQTINSILTNFNTVTFHKGTFSLSLDLAHVCGAFDFYESVNLSGVLNKYTTDYFKSEFKK